MGELRQFPRRQIDSVPSRRRDWLTAIRSDPRIACQPHLSFRFLIDLAEYLSGFKSFFGEGCYASQTYIARYLGVTPRQVRRGIAALKDLGHLINVRRGKTRTNLLQPVLPLPAL